MLTFDGAGLITKLCGEVLGGVPPSGVRAEGVGFAVGALQGPHGGREVKS